jgi:hypothetical protein
MRVKKQIDKPPYNPFLSIWEDFIFSVLDIIDELIEIYATPFTKFLLNDKLYYSVYVITYQLEYYYWKKIFLPILFIKNNILHFILIKVLIKYWGRSKNHYFEDYWGLYERSYFETCPTLNYSILQRLKYSIILLSLNRPSYSNIKYKQMVFYKLSSIKDPAFLIDFLWELRQPKFFWFFAPTSSCKDIEALNEVIIPCLAFT